MGAYTTLAVNQDSYNRIIDTIKNGYTGKDGIKHRPRAEHGLLSGYSGKSRLRDRGHFTFIPFLSGARRRPLSA